MVDSLIFKDLHYSSSNSVSKIEEPRRLNRIHIFKPYYIHLTSSSVTQYDNFFLLSANIEVERWKGGKDNIWFEEGIFPFTIYKSKEDNSIYKIEYMGGQTPKIIYKIN